MKKFLIWIFLSSVLAGCAGKPQYGDFTPAPNLVVDFIAEDATKQLATIYPIAHTSFKLNPEVSGVMGLAIEEKLRDTGFAVSYIEGNELNYVFDVLSENRLRLTLDLSETKLSRLYSSDANRVETLTKWTVFSKE